MTTRDLIFVFAIFVMTMGCRAEPSTTRQDSQQQASTGMGGDGGDRTFWPKDAEGLVARLNDWHFDELEVYNEPERFPNRVVSGETNSWVFAHEEELAKLGVEIEWDRQRKTYVIAKAD